MSTFRRRMSTLVLVSALVVMLIPAGPASAVFVADSGGAATPVGATRLLTVATPDGIRLTLMNEPKNGCVFDVYRSEDPAQRGGRINDEPATGTFVDTSAVAGTRYFYSLVMHDPDATVLGPESQTAYPLHEPAALPGTHVAPMRPTAESAEVPQAVRDAAAVARVSALAGAPLGTVDATTAVSGTWSGTVYVGGDLVVPAGQTLTIRPGTTVYFDTAASSAQPGFGLGGDNPTPDIDLIVHGKLLAQGTSTSPITFTSVNAAPGSATLPGKGDWGCVYTDSRAASAVSYARFEYGAAGIAAYRTGRPTIANCVFSELSNSGGPMAAVLFLDPIKDAVTPRVSITNCTITASDEGIAVVHYLRTTTVGDRILDPYVAGNTIRAALPLHLEIYGSGSGNVQNAAVELRGTLKDNRCYASASSALYLYCENNEGYNASVLTASSNNVYQSVGGSAVTVHLRTQVQPAVANCSPTFTGDRITADDGQAVRVQVDELAGSIGTVSSAIAAPRFTSCQLRNDGEDTSGKECVDVFVGGTSKVGALAAPVFSGCTIASSTRRGVAVEAGSSGGPATASPKFSTCTLQARMEGVTSLAYVSGAVAAAKSLPAWSGGKLASAGDAGIIAQATSENGAAEARPTVSSTEIRASESAIKAMALAAELAGNGNADASGSITDAVVISTMGRAYDGFAASDSGSTRVWPVITNSSLTAENVEGIVTTARSESGPASAKPTLTDTSVWSNDSALLASANDKASSAGSSSANPKLTRATLFSKSGSPVYAEARSQNSGAAEVSPVISGCDLLNGSGSTGVHLSAECPIAGNARVAPSVSSTNIKSDYSAIHAFAQTLGAGKASVLGSFTGCVFSSSFDDAVRVAAEARGGGAAEARPSLSSCMFESLQAGALDVRASGFGSAGATFTAAPIVSGGSVAYSLGGVFVGALQRDELGVDAADYVVAPRITNIPLHAAQGLGVETWAVTGGDGDAINAAYVGSSPIKSSGGLFNLADCGGTGDATNRSLTSGTSTKKMGVESWGGWGVRNTAQSAGGSAADLSTAKYLSVASRYGAIDSIARAAGVSAVCDARPTIASNSTSMNWLNDQAAISVGRDARRATNPSGGLAPSITGNALGGSYSDGIQLTSSGAGKAAPVISGNSIPLADANGISVYASVFDADSTITLTKNTVDKTRFVSAWIENIPAGLVEQNKFTNPGWAYGFTDLLDSSALVWKRPDHTRATVRGNLIAGARTSAVVYYGGAAKTEWNSFVSTSGLVNRPFCYWSDASETTSTMPWSARYNYWGSTDAAMVASLINTPDYSGAPSDIVTATPVLTALAPRITSIGVSKTSTKVKFTLKFDRPMDRSVTRLYFGKSSPYRSYNVTGSWSSDGRTFTGTRSRSGLPARVTMYFSGARDLPGTAMYSKSKGFKL